MALLLVLLSCYFVMATTCFKDWNKGEGQLDRRIRRKQLQTISRIALKDTLMPTAASRYLISVQIISIIQYHFLVESSSIVSHPFLITQIPHASSRPQLLTYPDTVEPTNAVYLCRYVQKHGQTLVSDFRVFAPRLYALKA